MGRAWVGRGVRGPGIEFCLHVLGVLCLLIPNVHTLGHSCRGSGGVGILRGVEVGTDGDAET